MPITVNGEALREEEIKLEMERMRPQFEQAFQNVAPEQREAQLREWAEENVVERVLLTQAAERDVEPPPEELVEKAWEQAVERCGGEEQLLKNVGLSSPREVKEDIARHMRTQKLLGEIVQSVPEPTEEDLRVFYEENQEQFMRPEMIRASHIVKHHDPEGDPAQTRSAMAKALKKLRNNGHFAEVAAEFSECPDNGGELGWFARGKMVPAFEDVVFAMQPGEISEVFETEFGLHVATLHERKPAEQVPFEELKDRIGEHVRERARQEAIEAFVDAEKEKAEIRAEDA